MKKFRCTVCGYIHEGDAAPEKCPLCKAPASKFVEVVEAEEGGALTFADEHVERGGSRLDTRDGEEKHVGIAVECI